MEVSSIFKDLMPHQIEGVKFLSAKSPRKKLLLDECGLGKSAQAIRAADLIFNRYLDLSVDQKALYPVFQVWIVCPAFAVRSWEREIKRWSQWSEKIQKVLTGRTEIDLRAHWVIMSYDIAKTKANDIKEGCPTILVCDEAHFCKRRTSDRAKLVLDRIGSAARHVWLLTGTLFPDKRADAWTLINACDRGKLNFWQFCEKFGYVRKFRVYGREVKEPYGARNEEELLNWIRPFTLMRKAKDHLDLPPFEDREVYIAANKETKAVSGDISKELLKKALMAGHMLKLEEFSQAINILGNAKIEAAVQYVDNLIEQNLGPVVVFATNVSVVEGVASGLAAALSKRFPKNPDLSRVEVFHGGIDAQKRGLLAEEYERGLIQVLVCNIKAAGVNLTLVRGNQAVFVQEPWSPGDLTQARGRIRRIGQKRPCIYHTLLVENSLDETIHEVIRSKKQGSDKFDEAYSANT